MSYFDSIYAKLFPSGGQGRQFSVKEIIKRNESEQVAYHLWKLSDEREELIKEIATAYHLKKHQPESGIVIHHYKSIYANGFAIHYHPLIGKKNFVHLFDYFKDKVTEMGYRGAGSDRQLINKRQYVETLERHYLKPQIQLNKHPADQQYGNVLVEHVAANRQPHFIKVIVNIYSDRLYKEPLSYHEFIGRLFQP